MKLHRCIRCGSVQLHPEKLVCEECRALEKAAKTKHEAPSDIENGRLVTDSEIFHDVHYEIRDGQVIVWTKNDGVLVIGLKNAPAFINELRSVCDMWGGVRT